MLIETNEINISGEIEKIVLNNKDGYIQAILSYCEEKNIDPSYVAKYLSKPIIEKIRAEGETINLLPKSARLPL
jgi:hypothetical protein